MENICKSEGFRGTAWVLPSCLHCVCGGCGRCFVVLSLLRPAPSNRNQHGLLQLHHTCTPGTALCLNVTTKHLSVVWTARILTHQFTSGDLGFRGPLRPFGGSGICLERLGPAEKQPGAALDDCDKQILILKHRERYCTEIVFDLYRKKDAKNVMTKRKTGLKHPNLNVLYAQDFEASGCWTDLFNGWPREKPPDVQSKLRPWTSEHASNDGNTDKDIWEPSINYN